MVQAPPDTNQRNTNLDDLKKKVKEWVEKEQTRITDQNAFLQSVLKARGVSKPKTRNLNEAVLATVDEINDFLSG